jgi:anaerobic magnesium-protoporphyrin IX monomethyl ester cyclase
MWSRGCPYDCYFCGDTVFNKQRKRWRPVENIRAELADLQRLYGVRSVFVYDDEMVGVKMQDGWLTALADAIGPLGLTYKTQGRCSERWVTDEVCQDLYRSGCRVVMWGCESFSPKVLKRIGKGTTIADNWHTLRAAKRAGLKNWVFSMVGQLEETDEDCAMTADALGRAYREGLIDYRQTTVQTAVPGTELWDVQHRDGWFVEPPVHGGQMAQVYQDTPWLAADRIVHWLEEYGRQCPVTFL